MADHAKVQDIFEFFEDEIRPMGKFIGPPEDGVLEAFDDPKELLRYIRMLFSEYPVYVDGEPFAIERDRLSSMFENLAQASREGRVAMDPISLCCVLKAIDSVLGEIYSVTTSKPEETELGESV